MSPASGRPAAGPRRPGAASGRARMRSSRSMRRRRAPAPLTAAASRLLVSRPRPAPRRRAGPRHGHGPSELRRVLSAAGVLSARGVSAADGHGVPRHSHGAGRAGLDSARYRDQLRVDSVGSVMPAGTCTGRLGGSESVRVTSPPASRYRDTPGRGRRQPQRAMITAVSESLESDSDSGRHGDCL